MEFTPNDAVRELASFRELVSWAIGAFAPLSGKGSLEEVGLRVGGQSFHEWTDSGRTRSIDYGDCPGHQHAYWFLRMGLFQSFDLDWITSQKADPRFKEGPKARTFFDQQTLYKLDDLAFGARIPLEVKEWLATRSRDPRLKKRAVNGVIPFNPTKVRAAIDETRIQVQRGSTSRERLAPGKGGRGIGVPTGLPGPSGVVALSNLPTPWYGTYVERPKLEARVLKGLAGDRPVISLVGLSGRGKTTLAHRIALDQVGRGNQFRAVVWVSDEEFPGTTTLKALFEALSLTLNNPMLARSDLATSSRLSLAQLSALPTLLVLNNFETIVDGAIGVWLRLVPSPSKVILTTTVAPQGMGHLSLEIDVDRPDDSVAPAFFERLLAQRNLSGVTSDSDELRSLWVAADGNFKLLERSVGLLRKRPLEQILKEIGRSADPELDLLRESWSALSTDAKLIARAMSLFPEGVDHNSLIGVSGLSTPRFEAAMTELQDARFASPQIRGFALSYLLDGLAARRARTEMEQGVDEDLVGRWLAEALRIAESVGFCPDDVSRLRVLDAPGVRAAIEYAISQAHERGLDDIVIELCREVRYYYYVRGLWSATPSVNLLRAEAARRLADPAEEFDALVYHVNISAKQHNIEEVERHLPRLQVLQNTTAGAIEPRALAEFRHAQALYHHARGDCDYSERLWLQNLKSPDVLGPADYSANLRWFARCLVQRQDGRSEVARTKLQEAADHAQAHGFLRASLVIELQLAELDLDDCSVRPPADVYASLNRLRPRCEEIQDPFYLAEMEWLSARAMRLMDRTEESRDRALTAARLFESLGLSDRADIAMELAQ